MIVGSSNLANSLAVRLQTTPRFEALTQSSTSTSLPSGLLAASAGKRRHGAVESVA